MDALREFAYTNLGPFPVVFYLGLGSYALLLVTGATMGIARRLKRRRPVRAHHWLAYSTVAVATVHALLGIVTRV